MEAMLMGNPIISTNCGGIHEFLTEKEALLINCQMIPVKTNTRNQVWYTPDQKWADVSIDEVRDNLRWAFENQKKMKEMGNEARKTVIKNFSFETVGSIMQDRLLKISKIL
jgi:glycosyltransferase involved in cell wall biosynthesis